MNVAKEDMPTSMERAKKIYDDAKGDPEIIKLLFSTGKDAALHQIRPLQGTAEYWDRVEIHLDEMVKNS